MLVIWFDCNNGRFYLRFVSNYYDKYVGFVNQYGHEVVDMYGYNHSTKEWFKCNSYQDYIDKYKMTKPTAKDVIKSRLLDFINKL